MTEIEEGKLIATVEQLTTTVSALTVEVQKLVAKQNYWKGALAMLILMSAGMGAAASTILQWFHK